MALDYGFLIQKRGAKRARRSVAFRWKVYLFYPCTAILVNLIYWLLIQCIYHDSIIVWLHVMCSWTKSIYLNYMAGHLKVFVGVIFVLIEYSTEYMCLCGNVLWWMIWQTCFIDLNFCIIFNCEFSIL